MKKVLKQAVGIDCSKDELVVSIVNMDEYFEKQVVGGAVFANTVAGFEKLLKWVMKQRKANDPSSCFVIEATGIYHEQLCCYLYDKGYGVSVVLPNKASHFMRTLSVKTINDKISAEALGVMGLEKKLDLWQRPREVFIKLRQLSRERNDLLEESTSIKNQLHVATYGAFTVAGAIKRMEHRLAFIREQIAEIEQEIKALVNADQQLKDRLEKVCSIKGIGFITAVTVVAEMNGFNLIRNQRQLVSYCGLDVVKKDSGSTVRSKGRISHKGNTHIRKALYFPSLIAIRFDDNMKNISTRLVARHGIKMKAVVAIQRKLLVLIYILWKNNAIYDPNLYKPQQIFRATKMVALTELAHGRS
jgi:transposase